ncbi:alpha/beta fold hydrolase [Rhodococcus sp. NPDC057014]|uniref:alpha/beta fold hydrolase n=1 Tax=Rhodococcus sp. NPDC057014 TaxID=3346000 RepID=UPI00364466F8
MTTPVLLVHGAFTGAWIWDRVIAELDALGVPATAINLPSRAPGATLAADAQAVRDALKGMDAPAVLVGHSYAGVVITEASADNDDVAALVYVCAALPGQGESVSTLLARDPEPGDLGSAMKAGDDGTATLTRDGAKANLFNDATDEDASPTLDALGPHAVATLAEPVTRLGWQQHPSTYVITLQDKSFSPALQREFATHTTQAVEIDCGHGAMLTKPTELAHVIASAAQDAN